MKRVAVEIATIVAAAPFVAVRVAADVPLAEPSSGRVIHRFDFDERAAGNMEELPMHWIPVQPAGFPKFAGGRLDWSVGHAAPPSFYLFSEGRSVAFVYTGPKTRIHAQTDYEVSGFVRVQQLKTGRACLSAHFVSARGEVLLETTVRSEWIGGISADVPWQRVELLMRSPPPEAASIAVAVWILEEKVWADHARTPRYIAGRDLAGGAWFDDIQIRAVPRVELSSGRRENLLTRDDASELSVVLVDQLPGEINGRIRIFDVENAEVGAKAIHLTTPSRSTDSIRISTAHLSVGLYTAELDVATRDGHAIQRFLTFARIEKPPISPPKPSREVGVVLSGIERAEPAAEAALIRSLGVGSVKVPIWTAQPNESAAIQRARDRELRELAGHGLELTAVLAAVPGSLTPSSGKSSLTLDRLLREPADSWRTYLTDAAGNDPQRFSAWQIGDDRAVDSLHVSNLGNALDQLRSELRRWETTPRLTMPVDGAKDASVPSDMIDQLTIVLSPDTRPDEVAEQIRRFRSEGNDQPAAYVEPLSATEFRRQSRLADFAQRIVTARHAGADPVFVPQPWTVRRSASGTIVEPLEEFLILRTLAHQLGNAVPGEPLPIGPGVRCLPFYRGETALVVVWDASAPPEGRTHVTQLGRADQSTDLWGRVRPVPRDELGQHRLHLSAMPIVIDNVDRWLLTFRNAVRFEPRHVESGLEVVSHTLTMRHTGSFPLGGQVELMAPKGWELSPSGFRFTLAPDQETRLNLAIRYPPGEPAGWKQIAARFSLQNDAYHLEVPLTVEIGLTDVEVDGAAVFDGKDLVLRHAVTNHSAALLNFRSSAQVPSHERQYRPMNNLLPGETQTVEYRFVDAAGLSGSRVRLGLRPLSDGRRVHNLELLVP